MTKTIIGTIPDNAQRMIVCRRCNPGRVSTKRFAVTTVEGIIAYHRVIGYPDNIKLNRITQYELEEELRNADRVTLDGEPYTYHSSIRRTI